MSAIVPFTDNYHDLSNANGYQFEFVCERCGNGYRSPFVANKKERARGLLRGASSLLGGRFSEVSQAAEQLAYDRGTNSPEKDKALAHAVDAVRPQFKQCRGCGNWVCIEVCWNDDIGQCVMCSPEVAQEVSKAQAAAQVEQIRTKVRDVDWTKDLDLAERARVHCGTCGAQVEGAKFCPECGNKLTVVAFCSECGAEAAEGAKFCAECGHKF